MFSPIGKHCVSGYKWQVLLDKDVTSTALATSHDVHLLKIDHCQDDIYHRLDKWMNDMMFHLHEHVEFDRNRDILREIDHFVDYHTNIGNIVYNSLQQTLEFVEKEPAMNILSIPEEDEAQ